MTAKKRTTAQHDADRIVEALRRQWEDTMVAQAKNDVRRAIREAFVMGLMRAEARAMASRLNAGAARNMRNALADIDRRLGTENTQARPEKFRSTLDTYVMHLLRKERTLAGGKNPQVAIADRVRSQEASDWCIENKNWNRTANRNNATFYAARYVRAEVAAILPDVIRRLNLKK